MTDDRRPPRPQRRAPGGGFGMPRPKTPEPLPPGLGARLAAEQAIVEALGQSRPLDEFFGAASIAPRLDEGDGVVAGGVVDHDDPQVEPVGGRGQRVEEVSDLVT